MKWLGMDATTPANNTPGAMTTVSNARMKVEGELRRRRGTARTSLAKATSAITAIADFALSPSNPYALTYVSGTINGDQGISSLWSDVSLTPVSGASSPATGSSFTLTLLRGASQYATSILVFAKPGVYPSDGDVGTYVGNFAINPWATTAVGTFTAPASGVWYFRAYPVRDDLIGPGANLTPASMGGFLVTDTMVLSIAQIFPALALGCTISAPAPYVTSNGTTPSFALGSALMAGAISLPYSFTMIPGASGGGVPGVLRQAAPSWTGSSALPFAPVTVGVVCATVTLSTGRNVGIA